MRAAPAGALASCTARRSHPRTDRASASASVALAGRADGKGKLAYVADADDRIVHTVDATTLEELATTEISAHPEQLLVLPDGRIAATLRSANAIEVLEPGDRPGAPLESLCTAETPAEPIAMAITPDGSTLVVTSGWGHALTAFDTTKFETRWTADLPREPRSVLISDDGSRAFVSHVVGAKMSIVDLNGAPSRSVEQGSIRTIPVGNFDAMTLSVRARDFNNEFHATGCQGFALAKTPDGGDQPSGSEQGAQSLGAKLTGRIFAPMVTVNTGAGAVSSGYGDDGRPTEVSSVAVIDASAERPLGRVPPPAADRTDDAKPCLLPRAATYHAGRVYVACMGIDSLVEFDAHAIDPAQAELRRWPIGAGPTGVAIDDAAEKAFVWSQFDREIAVIDLKSDEHPSQRVALTRRANSGLAPEIAAGRALFHTTGDARISQDGRACASCHPDGRDDALTWSTPDGARQTPMLAGRVVGSEPYGWLGNSQHLDDHVRGTFTRLKGTGLVETELAALLAYVKASAPPVPRPSRDPARVALVERGASIFGSQEAGCSNCHDPALLFTDGKRHDVEHRGGGRSAEKLDTPSLRFIGGTAPYFHDGRYASLDEMLSSPAHAMGASLHLSRNDRSALVAYLDTL